MKSSIFSWFKTFETFALCNKAFSGLSFVQAK
uniref:Uncharacterized protein n=1 Tax=Medicago truncatula TaxID=3880 RepID=I3S5L1_MEDTR|nr:unknown [Medicago truncatula]